MKVGIDRFADKGRETSIRVRQERARRYAADLAPTIAELQASGATTLRSVAAALNARGIPTARGGKWTPVQVSRIFAWVASGQQAGVFPPGGDPARR
nr:recombinase-like helix-turn-helix domain-containing protein [Methylobacterium terricola]